MIRFYTSEFLESNLSPLDCVYRNWAVSGGWYGTKLEARVLGSLLVFRDLVVRYWGLHCCRMGLIGEGERAPWPSLLSFGFRKPRYWC